MTLLIILICNIIMDIKIVETLKQTLSCPPQTLYQLYVNDNVLLSSYIDKENLVTILAAFLRASLSLENVLPTQSNS